MILVLLVSPIICVPQDSPRFLNDLPTYRENPDDWTKVCEWLIDGKGVRGDGGIPMSVFNAMERLGFTKLEEWPTVSEACALCGYYQEESEQDVIVVPEGILNGQREDN